MSGGVLEEISKKERVKKDKFLFFYFFYFFRVSQLKYKNTTALLHCYQLAFPIETLNVFLLP